jgi:4-hydroxy-tetrahydrodipicolinate reductase
MKLALHGYGKMGHAVEKVAKESGHQVVDASSAEVLIDFSSAAGVDKAVDIACQRHIDLVIGSTGWNDRIDGVRQKIEKARIGCVYASNFSPGANVVFLLARRAGELFKRFPQYAAGIEERHHSQKKDAPSGTALRIAREVGMNPAIVSSRVGSEFGLHTLFFDSPDDLIEIVHRARGREGFARGAVLAAEMIRGKKGLITFDELVMS